jgi:MscS family membrane protein
MVKLADKTESTLDDQLVPMVRKALKIFVIIIGLIVILMNLNIDIVPLLTGLSIGGLAFALAAQDTLKNFFGSIMIFIDKPFQIGDWITSGDIDGTVEEVGFRATRVRTFRNSVTYVPNGMIADRTVDNHGLRRYRRFYTKIAITYDTPSDLVNVFVEGLRNIVLNHPHTWKENFHVYLNDMADSSLSVMFYIFFKAPTWGDELKYRHEVLIEIIRLAENIGINFAFPTRTLHMETFPEKKGNSPEYETDTSMLKKQLQAFLKKPKSWDQEN